MPGTQVQYSTGQPATATATATAPPPQGRPGTARNGGPADLWHGPARKIMARKILARHGTENLGIWTRFRSKSMIFEQLKIPKILYMNFKISGKSFLIRPETIFPKVVRLEK